MTVGTLDDFDGQIAKVYATVPEEGVKQVNFPSGIVGLDTDVIRKRASQRGGERNRPKECLPAADESGRTRVR